MDNDDVNIGTILTRRQALRLATGTGLMLAMGATPRQARAAATTAPTTQPQIHLVATPQLTEGPFFVDERLNRSNLLAGTTRPSVINGLPLLLSFTIYRLGAAGYAPLKNVQLDVWNADASGAYSDESNPMNGQDTAGQRWLRGYQLTDAAGNATFSTIFPGWYNGRAPHIHFKVRQFTGQSTTRELTSQLFLTDTDRQRIYTQPPYNAFSGDGTTNAQDDIYSQRLPDGAIAGELTTLKLLPNPKGKGHAANFAIALTDENFTTGGRERRGPGGSFGGPPDGPPGPPPPPGAPGDLGIYPPWWP